MVQDYQVQPHSASEIAQLMGHAQQRGNRNGAAAFRVPCPAHNGQDANLQIWDKPDGGLGVDCHSHQCEYGAILDSLRAKGIIITGPAPITPLERAQRKAERNRIDMIIGEAPPPETPEAAAEVAAVASGEALPSDIDLLALYLNPTDNRSESHEADIARLLLYCGERVALVRDGDSARFMGLDSSTGHWNEGDTLYKLFAESAAAWRDGLYERYERKDFDAQALGRALRVSEKHKTEHRRMEIQAAAGGAFLVLTEMHGAQLANVTQCEVGEVNGNLDVLGVANGVVDLQTGQIIPPETARQYMVTRSTGVRYVKGATHPAVDKLLERQRRNPDNYQWFLQALGYALRGQPTRRLYFLIGEKAGGKSTVLNAIHGCLGQHAYTIPEGTLTKGSQKSISAGLTPQLIGFQHTRIALSSEPAEGQTLSSSLLKKLSGDDLLNTRDLHKPFTAETDKEATATIFLAANTGMMPTFDMDDALDDRLRSLEWETIPESERDLGLKKALKTVGAKQALLALLIEFAVTTERPPQDVPAVAQARQTMRSELVGDELAQWLSEHFVADSGATPLPTFDVWDLAIKDGVSDSDSKGRVSVFGYPRRTFTDKVRTYFAGRTGKDEVSGKRQAVYFGIRKRSETEIDAGPCRICGKPKEHAEWVECNACAAIIPAHVQRIEPCLHCNLKDCWAATIDYDKDTGKAYYGNIPEVLQRHFHDVVGEHVVLQQDGRLPHDAIGKGVHICIEMAMHHATYQVSKLIHGKDTDTAATPQECADTGWRYLFGAQLQKNFDGLVDTIKEIKAKVKEGPLPGQKPLDFPTITNGHQRRKGN